MSALSFFRQVLIMNPLEAVASDFVAQFFKCRRNVWAALQSSCHTKHGQRQLAFFKLSQDAPHALARAVIVNPIHAHVPRWETGRVKHLGEKSLRAGIAMQDMVFATLFKIQHELHSNARTMRPRPRPLGVRHIFAVACEIARIGGGAVVNRGHLRALQNCGSFRHIHVPHAHPHLTGVFRAAND